MYSINPHLEQSNENFQISTEQLNETVKDLERKYKKSFAKLDADKLTKAEKSILLGKLEQIQILLQVIRNYQSSTINLLEQYYFLYSGEKSTVKDWKAKYNKLKRYASDKGVDTTLVNWL
jgi:Cdc6-like AAA superfamily ATPase